MLVIPAGLAYIAVNFVVARLVHQVLWNGKRVGRSRPSSSPSTSPRSSAPSCSRRRSPRLLPIIGTSALLLVSPLVLVPQLAAALTRMRPVSERSPGAATVLYTRALASELRLDRRERRRAVLAAQMLAGGEPSGAGLHDLGEARFLTMHAFERYDGHGAPAQLEGGLIPLGSRILATAAAWSALTATGTATLPHDQALLDLQLHAGADLDPGVVAAAGRLIATEQQFARQPGAAPILHRLPAPLAARPVLARLVGSCVLPA